MSPFLEVKVLIACTYSSGFVEQTSISIQLFSNCHIAMIVTLTNDLISVAHVFKYKNIPNFNSNSSQQKKKKRTAEWER